MYSSFATLRRRRSWLIPWLIAGFVVLQVLAPLQAEATSGSSDGSSVARLSNEYGTLLITQESTSLALGGVISQIAVFTDPDGRTISLTVTKDNSSDPAVSVQAVLPGGIMSARLFPDGIADLMMTPASDVDSQFSGSFLVADEAAVEAVVSSDDYLVAKNRMLSSETVTVVTSMQAFFEHEGITPDNAEPTSPWQGGNAMTQACRNAVLHLAAAYGFMLLGCVTPAVIVPAICAAAITAFFGTAAGVAASCD